jgi:hypothetical protein
MVRQRGAVFSSSVMLDLLVLPLLAGAVWAFFAILSGAWVPPGFIDLQASPWAGLLPFAGWLVVAVVLGVMMGLHAQLLINRQAARTGRNAADSEPVRLTLASRACSYGTEALLSRELRELSVPSSLREAVDGEREVVGAGAR